MSEGASHGLPRRWWPVHYNLGVPLLCRPEVGDEWE